MNSFFKSRASSYQNGIIALAAAMYIALGSSSCSTARAQLQDASKPVVIFIPGYKGSLLENSKGDNIWLSASEIFFGSNSLAVPNPAVSTHNLEELNSGGVFKDISLLWGLISYDIYGDSLENLKKLFPGYRIRQFAYDWRKDLFKTVQSLDRVVKEEKEKSGKPLILAAHSMGGLIGAYYLRYGANQPDTTENHFEAAGNFSLVIFAGVPFKGAIGILEDLQQGDELPFNKHLLSARAVNSFASAYYLLPSFEGAVVDCREGSDLTPRLMKAKEFLNWKFGLAGDAFAELKLAPRLNLLTTLLNNAASFTEAIDRPYEHGADMDKISAGRNDSPPQPLPKILSIFGRRGKALEQAAWSKEAKRFLFSEKDLKQSNCLNTNPYGPGDDVVHVKSSALPAAFNHFSVSRLHTELTHTKMFLEPSLKQAIRELLPESPKPLKKMSQSRRTGDQLPNTARQLYQ